ncbi:hypothetical protein ACFFIS_10620 [Virgibacillus soli]|uniref:Uncharacterized protein n=1 Tax=Paracerasibacillus soli TaxID=480284 RepID=A0ABU5CNU0_9BACI|nr:hypothetical protein [Virgibacillus soli]MDY0407517.1 hypothetical protein [Virgibacillus soli]
MDKKFYIYQIIGVGIIWLGMAFFFSKMDDTSKIIFYVVTSWMLFLFVLLGKKIARDRQEKNEKNSDIK